MLFWGKFWTLWGCNLCYELLFYLTLLWFYKWTPWSWWSFLFVCLTFRRMYFFWQFEDNFYCEFRFKEFESCDLLWRVWNKNGCSLFLSELIWALHLIIRLFPEIFGILWSILTWDYKFAWFGTESPGTSWLLNSSSEELISLILSSNI